MNDNPAVSSIRFINASVKILARDELLEFPMIQRIESILSFPQPLFVQGKPKVSISLFKDQKNG